MIKTSYQEASAHAFDNSVPPPIGGSLAHSDFICTQGYPLLIFSLEYFMGGIETVYQDNIATALTYSLVLFLAWRDAWIVRKGRAYLLFLCVGFGLCLYNGLWDMRDDLITGFEIV
jgi:hypothetical protein